MNVHTCLDFLGILLHINFKYWPSWYIIILKQLVIASQLFVKYCRSVRYVSLLNFLFFAFVSHAHPFLPQMNDLLQPLSGSMNINTRIIYNRCILIYSRLMYTTLSICLGVLLSFNAKCWSFLFQKIVVPKKRFAVVLLKPA